MADKRWPGKSQSGSNQEKPDYIGYHLDSRLKPSTYERVTMR